MNTNDSTDAMEQLIELIEEIKPLDPDRDRIGDWERIMRYIGNRFDETTGLIDLRYDQTRYTVLLEAMTA